VTFRTPSILTEPWNPVAGSSSIYTEYHVGRPGHGPHILSPDHLGYGQLREPVHVDQERATYNDDFQSVCYLPLFLFNQFGDCEGALLRPGNVRSAEHWREVAEPVADCYRRRGMKQLFRGDAAFAKPELYEFLEARVAVYSGL
jgi:hypothetical protein